MSEEEEGLNQTSSADRQVGISEVNLTLHLPGRDSNLCKDASMKTWTMLGKSNSAALI